jgi:hypothetical protein
VRAFVGKLEYDGLLGWNHITPNKRRFACGWISSWQADEDRVSPSETDRQRDRRSCTGVFQRHSISETDGSIWLSAGAVLTLSSLWSGTKCLALGMEVEATKKANSNARKVGKYCLYDEHHGVNLLRLKDMVCFPLASVLAPPSPSDLELIWSMSLCRYLNTTR